MLVELTKNVTRPRPRRFKAAINHDARRLASKINCAKDG